MNNESSIYRVAHVNRRILNFDYSSNIHPIVMKFRLILVWNIGFMMIIPVVLRTVRKF